MKLKAGNKVLLKKEIPNYANSFMIKMLGKNTIIVKLYAKTFVCSNSWIWLNNSIEKVIKDKIQSKLK